MPKQTTLDEAIALVKKKYKYAITASYIIHPVEWSLYNAWKDLNIREAMSYNMNDMKGENNESHQNRFGG